MIWRIAVRPEVEWDVAKAAAWYEERQPGLGLDFIAEVVRVWDALAGNPLLNSHVIQPRIFAGERLCDFLTV